MAYKNRATIETVRSLAFGGIGAAYAAVGAITTVPTRILYAVNATDKDLWISDDGTNNKFFIPTGSFILIDLTANKVRDDGFFLPEQTYWYAKHAGAAPTSGSIYITLING